MEDIKGLMKSFKIYPHYKEKTNKYYEIFVFDDYDSMYTYYKNTCSNIDVKFGAVCRSFEIYDCGINKNNKIGEILIPLKNCRTGVIAHECGHAAFQCMRKISDYEILDHIDKHLCWSGEELYCTILGELSKQFVNNLYKYNLIDNEEENNYDN